MSSSRNICSLETPSGVWKLYLIDRRSEVEAMVFDGRNPTRVLWHGKSMLLPTKGQGRSARLSWRGSHVVVHYRHRSKQVSVTLTLSVDSPDRVVYSMPAPARTPQPATQPSPPLGPAVLERVARNPILAPRSSVEWESQAVFNAAAIEIDGRVHLVYRAVGDSGMSVLGYASSDDGEHIGERSSQPAFIDHVLPTDVSGIAVSDSRYQSGPGLSGCEDPRIVQIEDRIYMTYTAFDGAHPPGVAMTSIAKDDFVARRWTWRTPTRISAPAEAHKNWVLFPEKIGGRYALLHGISPTVQIDFSESLEFADGAHIQSRYSCSGNEDSWDNRIRGAGAPPIRTDQGWLVLYHAMDRCDPGRYKVGAMLLDLDDPCRILARLPHPLLEPDARYENDGHKQGVVYVCGAVLRGDRLFVYYGGADTVVCLATVALRRLIGQMVPAARSGTALVETRQPHEGGIHVHAAA